MYRIIFNPKSGQWEIHLSRWIVFWVKVKDAEFVDFNAAKERAAELGLDRAYKCWNERPRLVESKQVEPPARMPPPWITNEEIMASLKSIQTRMERMDKDHDTQPI